MKNRIRVFSVAAAAIGATALTVAPAAAYDVDAWGVVNSLVFSTPIPLLAATVGYSLGPAADCVDVSADSGDNLVPEVSAANPSCPSGSGILNQDVCLTGTLSGQISFGSGDAADTYTYSGVVVAGLVVVTEQNTQTSQTGAAVGLMTPAVGNCVSGITELSLYWVSAAAG